MDGDEHPAGVIAKVLTRVSMEEREEAFEDVHAVSSVVEETDDLLLSRLAQLDLELQKVPNREAFDQAVRINKDYVHDRNKKLLFLRAGSYDPADGARRMVCHYAQKLEFFGSEKLARDITIEDFQGRDLECLQSGMCQFLNHRDRAGRGIVFQDPTLAKGFERNARWRVILYMAMVMTEDVEVQRRGVVSIFYRSGDPMHSVHSDSTGSRFAQFVTSLPVRVSVMHVAFNSTAGVFPKLSNFINNLNPNSASRMKIHDLRGTHAEMQYSLMTFGIPVDQLPVDLDGKPIRKYHEDWLRSRRELESIRASTEREDRRSEKAHETITAAVTSSSSSSGTDTPITFHKDDVLLGREKVAQGHTGNFRFQYIIEEHWDEYDKSSKAEKTALATRIVNLVKQDGRFLKFNEEMNGWEEIDDKSARIKVSMAFRSKRRSYALSNKRRQSNDSGSISSGKSCQKRPKGDHSQSEPEEV